MRTKTKSTVRVVFVIVALAAAVFLAFYLMPQLYHMEGATERIVMLTEDVTEGTRIDENMCAYVEIGTYGLSTSVVKDAEQIIGRYAAQDISSKDLLFAEKFRDEATHSDGSANVVLSEDQMLLTLSLQSVAAGGAGKILPGDKVNTAVYIKESTNYYSDSGETKATTEFPAALQGLTVYRVSTANLQALDPDSTDNSSSNARIPAYITLVVTQAQADLLINYSYTNTVHFIEAD